MGDYVSPADVPEGRRVDVENFDDPDLFVEPDGDGGQRLFEIDIWGDEAVYAPFWCSRMLFRQYKAKRGRAIDARALTDVWKVLVRAMPWLAPITVPASRSARLRLIEVALQSVIRVAGAGELDPMGAWFDTCCERGPPGPGGAEAAKKIFDTGDGASEHAIGAVRSTMERAMAHVMAGPQWAQMVGGRLEAAWAQATRHVVVRGLAGAIAFPAGSISAQLEQLPTLAPYLTGCIANEDDEDEVRRRLVAVGMHVQERCGGTPFLTPENTTALADGRTAAWPVVAAVIRCVRPADADMEADQSDEFAWIGRCETVAEMVGLVQTAAAAYLEARLRPGTVTQTPTGAGTPGATGGATGAARVSFQETT